MHIITFSGVDGSGKSTQVARLKTFLEMQNKKVVYFHAIQFSLLNRIYRLKHLFQGNTTKKKGGAQTKSSHLGIAVRKIFLFVDIFFFRLYLSILRLRGVHTLLSDRYFYDTIVNIAYLEGSSVKTTSSFIRTALASIPRPTRAFFIDVSAESIVGRARVPEQGIAYLKDKIDIFHEIATLWGLITLPGESSQDEIFETIKKSL